MTCPQGSRSPLTPSLHGRYVLTSSDRGVSPDASLSRRDEAPQRGSRHVTAVKLRGAAIGACVSAVVLAGCSSGDGSSPAAQKSTMPTTPAATSSSQTFSPAESAVIKAYVGFWGRLPAASKASSDGARVAALVPVATDPELSQLISSMHKQREHRRVLYGQHVAHIESITIDGDRAEVRDCQDASAAGIATLGGRKLTVGVKRNPVRAVLLMRGGSWKVSTITYPKGASC